MGETLHVYNAKKKKSFKLVWKTLWYTWKWVLVCVSVSYQRICSLIHVQNQGPVKYYLG